MIYDDDRQRRVIHVKSDRYYILHKHKYSIIYNNIYKEIVRKTARANHYTHTIIIAERGAAIAIRINS
jgi:hypothetical protein